MLATSRALRRLDREGRALWTVPLATEARFANVSADGKVGGGRAGRRHAALAPRRGRPPLLSLLVLADGRWVLWTESGYFDAGTGAEDLVGWLVARPGGEQVDYFGVSRFRERYLRPDVLDLVLAERDPARALQRANDARMAKAKEAEPEVIKTIQAGLAPVPVTRRCRRW